MEAPAEPQDLMDAAPATQETDFMDLGVAPAETEKTEDAFDYLDFGTSAAQPASVSAPAEDPFAALAEPAEEKKEEEKTEETTKTENEKEEKQGTENPSRITCRVYGGETHRFDQRGE